MRLFFSNRKLAKFCHIDFQITNVTALSVVSVLQYSLLPLALCQMLKSGNYLKAYRNLQ